MTEIRFSSYEPGDEKHILDLFPKCFAGRRLAPEYWDWRFKQNPLNDIKIQLAWVENQLVGHYAVSPAILSVKGKYYKAAQSVTTMCDPVNTFGGLLQLLADQLHESLSENAYAAMWCFPNATSHAAFVRNLCWKDIYEIPMLTLDLKKYRSTKVDGAIVELREFGPEFETLWAGARQFYDILTKRDQLSLKWRFKDNPIVNYRILGYFSGGELLGYLVFSIYCNDQLQIVDLFSFPQPKVARELIKGAVNIARETNMRVVKIWMPIHNLLHLELERMGFVNKEPIIYFLAKMLKSEREIEDIWDARRWYLAMGDCDNF